MRARSRTQAIKRREGARLARVQMDAIMQETVRERVEIARLYSLKSAKSHVKAAELESAMLTRIKPRVDKLERVIARGKV